DDLAFALESLDTTSATSVAPVPAVNDYRRRLAWGLAAVGLAATIALVVAPFGPTSSSPRSGPVRVNAALGADVSVATPVGALTFPGANLALSPDGSLLAFAGQKDASDIRRLYIRRLERLQATALPGTENAAAPFFSPDGQWMAFFAEGKLKKIS